MSFVKNCTFISYQIASKVHFKKCISFLINHEKAGVNKQNGMNENWVRFLKTLNK